MYFHASNAVFVQVHRDLVVLGLKILVRETVSHKLVLLFIDRILIEITFRRLRNRRL